MSNYGVDVVIPSEEELSSAGGIQCTQKGCDAVFQGMSNLRMHLIKHHRIDGSLHGKGNRFACPVLGCNHFIGSNKYFASLKLIKQHYAKCHGLKKFPCSKCPKAFALERQLRSHLKACGKVFLCTCSSYYGTREALLTHCKRKSHEPAPVSEEKSKPKYAEKAQRRDEKLLQVCITSGAKKGAAGELTVFPTHYVAAIALSELSSTFVIPKNCNTSVQTVALERTKSKTSSKLSTRETQTGKNTKKSTETQTNSRQTCTKCGDEIKKRRKSTETQTKKFMQFLSIEKKDETLDCLSDSSSNNADDRKSPSLNDSSIWATAACRSDADEQNGLSSFDRLCNNETQTDLDGIFPCDMEGTSSAETQTTDDLIEDLVSHMCTQTTDFFDFDSWVDTSDNQTQTAWPDM